MKKTEFHYPSADGSTTISAVLWEPEDPPRAVLHVAHGITEHMGRYETFSRYFTERGVAVAGNDHLGHGRSLNGAEPLPMYFGPAGSWRFVVEDIKACAGWLKRRFPGVPYGLLGFSLGSFAVRCLVGEADFTADFTVWAGTGQTGSAERAIAGIVANGEARRHGDKTATPLLRKLTMENYNQRFRPCRTGADWLCANEAAVDEYLADPLCGDCFTVGSFRELLRGMKESADPARVKRMPNTMPVLLISGEDDPVGGFGVGVNKVERLLKNCGIAHVEKQLFPGMRHDLFHEKDCQAVFERIACWMDARLANKKTK